MVEPATVVGWRRQGFKLLWRWKSRKRGPGRPRIHKDIRKLIVEMADMNVGWGAPRPCWRSKIDIDIEMRSPGWYALRDAS